jgi:hypothetical protein
MCIWLPEEANLDGIYRMNRRGRIVAALGMIKRKKERQNSSFCLPVKCETFGFGR